MDGELLLKSCSLKAPPTLLISEKPTPTISVNYDHVPMTFPAQFVNGRTAEWSTVSF